MRKAPFAIVLIVVGLLAIPVLFVGYSHFFAGRSGAVATPSSGAAVAQAPAITPTATLLSGLVEAAPLATAPAQVVAAQPPAEPALDLSPTRVPSQVETPLVSERDDLQGESTEPSIIQIAPLREDDLGTYPDVQIPAQTVGSNELYVAHGDIYGTGRCYVHVFRPGDRVSGLAEATWRLVRIADGAPPQREDLTQEIQLAAAADPAAGGSCPFA